MRIAATTATPSRLLTAAGAVTLLAVPFTGQVVAVGGTASAGPARVAASPAGSQQAGRAGAAAGSGPPVPGKVLTWSDEFDGGITWGARWVGDRTTAYRYGDHNPDGNKLDWLDTAGVGVTDGVATFTARPSTRRLENGSQAWQTGFLTTEGSTEGFRVMVGDYAEARVRMPAGRGAWPALWTWNGDEGANGEVDSFEYHPDNPDLLELTNHVRPAAGYYVDGKAVGADRWVTVGTHYGADSVDWYVDGAKVFSDHAGVGAGWSAYLVLNLSVADGQYHPAPSGSVPITFSADYVRVYR
ncbi:beta-glucanase [Kitasatospora sp. NPDC056138]|uniref:glycoside hydrolase family 16 protein n=1 Tax=Kitasatospora sp. NPDC056138 TaxID=3345724 RepID=UPI0035DFA9BB